MDPNQEPENYRENWSSILNLKNDPELLQKTSIKLPKEKYNIKEVAYKEDKKHLSLIVTSIDNGLIKEDISLEKLLPEVEAVFCFFENHSKLEKFKDKLTLPDHEKIIFITPNKKTLTEKIFDIAKMLDIDTSANTELATILFATLIIETGNFSEKISKKTLSLGSLLLENGAEKKIISQILEKEKSPFSTQLLGRLLARTYVDETLGVSWSFLNNKDFQKTNNTSITPSFLYKLLKKAKILIRRQNLYILIWQSLTDIKVLVTTHDDKNENYLIPIAAKMQTELQSRFFVAGPFENFSKAEIELRKAIKEELEIEKTTLLR